MPLHVAGDPGYGSVSAGTSTGHTSSLGGSETVPLFIPEAEPEPYLWKPMSKEELDLAAGGPGWRKFRMRLVLVFWLGWFIMLGTAIAIIIQSPRPVAPPLHWWQKELFYRLQSALFMDAEGGTAGGISMVSERLPYVKSLGVGVIVLEGLFQRDVSPPNLTVIDPRLGTLPQFQQLITGIRKAGLKVVLDLCELDLELDFVKDPSIDTERLSDFSGHIQYSLRYWLEQGISGFGICDTDTAYSKKTLTEWRGLVQEFSTEDDERIVMVRQTGETLPAFNNSSPAVNGSLVELITRSLLPHSPHPLSAPEVADVMENHLQTPQGEWPSWTVGGKVSSELHDIIMVLLMTLPGTPVIKNGDEMSQSQVSSRMRHSAVTLFHSLSRTRSREEALLFGSFTFLPFNTTSVTSASANTTTFTPPLAFLRSWGCVHFLMLFNLGTVPHTLDPDWASSLPTDGVFVTSTGLDRLGCVSLQTITLQPHEGIVIKLFETDSYSN